MALEVTEIGKTPYNGEIHWLEEKDIQIINEKGEIKEFKKPSIQEKSGKTIESRRKRSSTISGLRGIIVRGRLKGKKTTISEGVKEFNKNPKESLKITNNILEQGHNSLGEVNFTAIYLENVSRLSTFTSWIPIGAPRRVQGVGTERSLRRAEPGDFIYAGNESLKELNESAFDVYSELKQENVKKEDARFGLTLATTTEEILQIPLGRELAKYSNYLQKQPSKEAKTIGKALKEKNIKRSELKYDVFEDDLSGIPLFKKDESLEIEQLFSLSEEELPNANYSPYYKTLVIEDRGSFVSYHQDIRNRQVDFTFPSWERIIFRNKYVVPPGLSKNQEKRLKEIYKREQRLGEKHWEEKEYESALLAQSLGKEIGGINRILGDTNIQKVIALRGCQKAQWEIRNRYRSTIPQIKEKFPFLLGANCEIGNECLEKNRENCPPTKYNRKIKRISI